MIGLINLLELIVTSSKFSRPAKNCASTSEEFFLIPAAEMRKGKLAIAVNSLNPSFRRQQVFIKY